MKGTLDIQVHDTFHFTGINVSFSEYSEEKSSLSMDIRKEADSLIQMLVKSNKFGVPPSIYRMILSSIERLPFYEGSFSY